MGGAVLELSGVVKRYGETAAVGPLDLEVPPGRTLALIGPSGAGKSTLLRLMLGLVAPDEGEVRFRGARVDPDDDALRRRPGRERRRPGRQRPYRGASGWTG